jgi:phosphoribosylformimino-5-aminoimidazole carboxamide ribotide isomerase
MLEIWASIDLMNGQVVRLVRGDPANSTIYSNDPVKTAKKWEKGKVDGLHIIDLDSTLGLGNNYEIIQKVVSNLSIPIQVGGGLHYIRDIERTLDLGVERVIVGTGLYTGRLDTNQLLKFGADKIVVALDHSNGKLMINGWRRKLDLELNSELKRLSEKGFKLFLSTNVSKDGTLEGVKSPILENISKEFIKNVYVAGGIASVGDLEYLKKIGVKGAVLGKSIYDGHINIEKALQVAQNDNS